MRNTTVLMLNVEETYQPVIYLIVSPVQKQQTDS